MLESVLASVPCTARDGKEADEPWQDLWIEDVIATARTGDVLLTRNKDSGAKIIRFFTRSEWNHVGIILKPSPTRAYLVEYVAQRPPHAQGQPQPS